MKLIPVTPDPLPDTRTVGLVVSVERNHEPCAAHCATVAVDPEVGWEQQKFAIAMTLAIETSGLVKTFGSTRALDGVVHLLLEVVHQVVRPVPADVVGAHEQDVPADPDHRGDPDGRPDRRGDGRGRRPVPALRRDRQR